LNLIRVMPAEGSEQRAPGKGVLSRDNLIHAIRVAARIFSF
jgi:hypothetical protein